MASLRAEKRLILAAIAAALGEDGVYDHPIPLSYPPRIEEFRPDLLTSLESAEMALGIEIDRLNMARVKSVSIDLYLPKRDLYIELDRAEHDMGAARGTTLLYYPEGLPKGFDPARYRAPRTSPSGSTSRMDAGRALSDFAKDLFIEGELGRLLVRLDKAEFAWLLERGDEGAKASRLKAQLTNLAQTLQLPQLEP